MQYSTQVWSALIDPEGINLLDVTRAAKFVKSAVVLNAQAMRVCVSANVKENEVVSSEQASSAGIGHDAHAQVDARGHRCPMPLLMAKRGLNALMSGQTLHVISTDMGSQRDFEVFAKQSGHQLLESEDVDGEFHFLLRKN
ncbi:MAG: sulfurtransferase TusA family protein [Congregibacter sp.]|nr:sulfurtransferase TusA family protein [Congregibacter sp.]